MHDWPWTVWVALVLASSVALAAVGFACVLIWIPISAWIEAYADFKNRPREPMDWCPKHGFFRKQHSLPVPGVPTVTMCPTCFFNSLRDSVKEPDIEVKK